MREEGVVLEDGVYWPRIRRLRRDVLALEFNGSRVGHFKARDHAQQCGLARARRSEHREKFACLDVQRDIFHHGVAREAFDDVA
jgi:hypothetical protein